MSKWELGGEIKQMGQTPTQPQFITIAIPTLMAFKVTNEQFAELARLNRDLRLERTARGELIVNPPTGGGSGRRNSSITGQLYKWFEANEELGEVFDSSTGFILPNGAERSPDAAWVSRQRWDSLTPEQQEGIVPLCPDFVVELCSKSDNLEPLSQKMREYIDNGVKLGWLLDRHRKNVEIYHSNREVEILDQPTELSGEDVLPGFVLNLTRVWR